MMIDTSTTNTNSTKSIRVPGRITIAHASVTGTTKRLAEELYHALLQQASSSSSTTTVQIGHVEEWDWWDELLHTSTNSTNSTSTNSTSTSTTQATTTQHAHAPPVLLLLLPTYTNGTWPPAAEHALHAPLQELVNDWRIAAQPLRTSTQSTRLHVAVFGMGSAAAYGNDGTAGQPARQAVRLFQRLGASLGRCAPVRVGDDSTTSSTCCWEEWKRTVVSNVLGKVVGATNKNNKNNKETNKKKEDSSTTACSSKGSDDCCQQRTHSNDKNNKNDGDDVETTAPFNESDDDDDDDTDDDDEEDDTPATSSGLVDLEDMGDVIHASSSSSNNNNKEPRPMVTPSQAKALQKEGYQLIGTHSAVKLCRWTKHQLRGRGGCYKHTFYGITSYQCMEATPSLACANKCVFCWRHHKNPVGKEWRWTTDAPERIVQEAIEKHVKLIQQTKGIPGVRMDRWHAAHTVKHCALSLVGEPIMYPHINTLLHELHDRHISTFLVTNGQHPHAIATLTPVTQLYVSVDAPTPTQLIAIDRPLFSDAWERLQESLTLLKDKRQRTVARLTVVKGWNSDEIMGYARLIALGRVSLVEVKGVTFCGKSDASNLNMTNTPWHHEVIALVQTLRQALRQVQQTTHPDLPAYDIACEHKHSCSVLLARVDQFAVDDPVTGERQWRTWIDYDKFQSLVERAEDPDTNFTFDVTDYTAPTPAWALFGASAEGFDPTDVRQYRKRPLYTQFDAQGIPTHDTHGALLGEEERSRLRAAMEDKMRTVGEGSTVTELRGGAKHIEDVSLMYRGLTVPKQ